MSSIILDFDRKARCGVEEAVFCLQKTPIQIEHIVSMAREKGVNLFFTRLAQDKFSTLNLNTQNALTYCPVSKTAMLGAWPELPEGTPPVAIVSGGSSDSAVCHEVFNTLRYHGVAAAMYEDVGVAALWRVTERLAVIDTAKVVIAVAGMEAALPTVLSGMIAKPIIAVPTSVGYGVSEGGQLALNACLGSCAAGLVTVNIDNGFGAACAAIKMLKSFS